MFAKDSNKPPELHSGTEKRIVSSGNKLLRVKELPDSGLANKRRTTVLTPDNANVVLKNAFDLESFSAALLANSDIVKDTMQLFDLMTKCVVDQSVCCYITTPLRLL